MKIFRDPLRVTTRRLKNTAVLRKLPNLGSFLPAGWLSTKPFPPGKGKKVKFALKQAMKAQGGSRVIALLFL